MLPPHGLMIKLSGNITTISPDFFKLI